MTDRYMGFLVTLDKDMREDDAECVINALKMIKFVQQVKPYLVDTDQYMIAEREKLNLIKKLDKFLWDELKGEIK